MLITSFGNYRLQAMVFIISSLHKCDIIELDFRVLANDDAPPSPQQVVQHHSQRQLTYQVINLCLIFLLFPQSLKISFELFMTYIFSDHISFNESKLFMKVFRLENIEREIRRLIDIVIELRLTDIVGDVKDWEIVACILVINKDYLVSSLLYQYVVC